MSDRWPGSVIRATAVTPSGPYANSTASGLWTLDQAAYWDGQGSWPTQGRLVPTGLWSWGYNYFGQLGLGNPTNYSSPKQVGTSTTWSTLFVGPTTNSTLAIRT